VKAMRTKKAFMLISLGVTIFASGCAEGREPSRDAMDHSAAGSGGNAGSSAVEGGSAFAAGSGGNAGSSAFAAGSGGNAGISTWSAACSAYAKAYCAQYLACYTGVMLERLGDLNTCEARFGGVYCESRMVSPGSSATASDLTTCAAAISAQNCSEWFVNVPVECMWRGTLSDGSPCEYDQQCGSTRCARVSGSWCGTCTPRVSLGGQCDPSLRDCERNLVCGAGVGCSGSLPDGGTCGETSDMICTTPVPEGGSCATNFECASALACISGHCSPQRRTGESCAGGLECTRQEDVMCKGAVCSAVSHATPGQACDYTNGITCLASGICKGADGQPNAIGVCVAPLADGQPCNGSTPCLYPSRCMAGKCMTAADAAELCR